MSMSFCNLPKLCVSQFVNVHTFSLFCGGYYPIGIQSVRLVESSMNYASVTRALCALDAMLSGSNLGIKPKDLDVLKHLMENYIKKDDDKITDGYIGEKINCL